MITQQKFQHLNFVTDAAFTTGLNFQNQHLQEW